MLFVENSNATNVASAPLVTEIESITAITHPIVRNLRITACYCELSAAFAARLGTAANWCTFATWASKQAGQTIRGEDMQRTIEEVLKKEPGIQEILLMIERHVKPLNNGQIHGQIRETILGKLVRSAVSRASDAVSRGNKKVFEEIGREFARFMATCFGDNLYTNGTIADFCRQLRPGDPPEGQEYLRRAFTRYYTAMYEGNEKKRGEMVLLANLEIGFHEQTRLQPEIEESLNAAVVDSQQIKDYLTGILINSKSAWGKAFFFLQKIAGKTALLNKAVDSLVLLAQEHIRRIISLELMTLTIPPDKSLRLGRDLVETFPAEMQDLSHPDLLALLAQIDPTSNSLSETGATDWADLKERLHFIADLFRCYHYTKDLFGEAFTPEQLAVLKAGGLPGGRL